MQLTHAFKQTLNKRDRIFEKTFPFESIYKILFEAWVLHERETDEGCAYEFMYGFMPISPA